MELENIHDIHLHTSSPCSMFVLKIIQIEYEPGKFHQLALLRNKQFMPMLCMYKKAYILRFNFLITSTLYP